MDQLAPTTLIDRLLLPLIVSIRTHNATTNDLRHTQRRSYGEATLLVLVDPPATVYDIGPRSLETYSTSAQSTPQPIMDTAQTT